MTKIKLYTCINDKCDYIGLNQHISYWEEKGWVERVHIPMLNDKRFISWVGRQGGLALEPSYVYYISKNTPYEYVLSSQYISKYTNDSKIIPWNFYVRDWKSYSKVMTETNERNIKSIFSGTIRGSVHDRNQWINSTEVFSYRSAKKYTRTNRFYPTIEDYYRALSKSKFALCPVGDCGICQRETETMGMGCVSMFTTGVIWNYNVPPVEGNDFIFVKDVDDMNDKMANMKENDMMEISHNAKEYYKKYCSPEGLWNTVLRTIEKYNIKVN